MKRVISGILAASFPTSAAAAHPPRPDPTGMMGPRVDPDGNGTHGLNERVEAKALCTARDYRFDLAKALAG